VDDFNIANFAAARLIPVPDNISQEAPAAGTTKLKLIAMQDDAGA
jgi:hypothetical protein